jgi:hypothetical protein
MIPMLRVRASGNSLMTGPSFAMSVLLSTYGRSRAGEIAGVGIRPPSEFFASVSEAKRV